VGLPLALWRLVRLSCGRAVSLLNNCHHRSVNAYVVVLVDQFANPARKRGVEVLLEDFVNLGTSGRACGLEMIVTRAPAANGDGMDPGTTPFPQPDVAHPTAPAASNCPPPGRRSTRQPARAPALLRAVNSKKDFGNNFNSICASQFRRKEINILR
jgi:hypothetical protein